MRTWDERNGRDGWFPKESVVFIDDYNEDEVKAKVSEHSDAEPDQESIGDEAESQENVPERVPAGTRAVAKYDYDPEKADEVELKKGEFVVITESAPGGWWKGMTGSGKAAKIGWFPANFVTTIPDDFGNSNTLTSKSTNTQSLNSSRISSSSEAGKSSKLNRSLSSEAQDGLGSLKDLTTAEPPGTDKNSPDRRKSWYKRLVSKTSSDTKESKEERKLRTRSMSAPLASSLLQSEKSRFTIHESSFDEQIKSISVPISNKVVHEPWFQGMTEDKLAKISPKEKHRQTAIWELIVTEKDYVNDLKIMIETFMRPMIEKKILTAKSAEQIFSNVEQLYVIHDVGIKISLYFFQTNALFLDAYKTTPNAPPGFSGCSKHW